MMIPSFREMRPSWQRRFDEVRVFFMIIVGEEIKLLLPQGGMIIGDAALAQDVNSQEGAVLEIIFADPACPVPA